jgi:ribosomal protein S3
MFFIKYVVLTFFLAHFKNLNIFGFKLLLSGKVGVAGNGRKRKVRVNFGKVSNFTLKYKVSYSLSLVNTFTGVLGLKIFLYYIIETTL